MEIFACVGGNNHLRLFEYRYDIGNWLPLSPHVSEKFEQLGIVFCIILPFIHLFCEFVVYRWGYVRCRQLTNGISHFENIDAIFINAKWCPLSSASLQRKITQVQKRKWTKLRKDVVIKFPKTTWWGLDELFMSIIIYYFYLGIFN